MLTRADWLLLFLGVDGGGYQSDQIRVMKGLFLLSQTEGHPAQGLYTFEPYVYGPFDRTVYRDLDALQLEGLVWVHRSLGATRKSYELTDLGKDRFARLAATVPQEEIAAVRDVKRHVTSLGFDALLEQIYDRYPAFAGQSVARVAQPA